MSITDRTLWTAIVMPFSHNGTTIDFQSLNNILRIQEKHNNGIVLLGSTGENLSLSEHEKRQILDFVCNANLSIPIICGVPSYNINLALEWIDLCNNLPLSGYLMTTPIYSKPGIIGQTEWFEKLLNKASHECMLYNIPSRAGANLLPQVISNLSQHKKFVAIKDSSGIINTGIDYQLIAPHIKIYCGDDNMMPAMAIHGTSGLVSVVSNAWPDATKKYLELCLSGTKIDVSVWWKACDLLFSTTNPIPIKALLKYLQIIENDIVRLPLSNQDLPSINNIIAADKIINEWMRYYA